MGLARTTSPNFAIVVSPNIANEEEKGTLDPGPYHPSKGNQRLTMPNDTFRHAFLLFFSSHISKAQDKDSICAVNPRQASDVGKHIIVPFSDPSASSSCHVLRGG